jgi:hypothetical protein
MLERDCHCDSYYTIDVTPMSTARVRVVLTYLRASYLQLQATYSQKNDFIRPLITAPGSHSRLETVDVSSLVHNPSLVHTQLERSRHS